MMVAICYQRYELAKHIVSEESGISIGSSMINLLSESLSDLGEAVQFHD